MDAGGLVEKIIDDDTEEELLNVNVSQRIQHYQQNIRRFIDSKSNSDLLTTNNSQKYKRRFENIKITKEKQSKSVPSIKAPKALPRRKSNYEALDQNVQVVERGKDDIQTIDGSKSKILPSVRLLALKFSKSRSQPDVSNDERVPHIFRGKFPSHQLAGSGDIHSITARTLSRRFR